MKIFRNSFLLLIFSAFLCSFASGQKVTEANPGALDLVMGNLNGRIYTNELLKFELKLPDEGIILNQAEIDVYKNAGVDLLKNGNAQNDARIETAARKEVIILNYAHKPLGSTGNFILVIGTVKQNSGVTLPMVVAATLKGMTATGKFELLKSLTGVVIGGLKADGLEGTLTTNTGIKVKERILILMRNGYSISFVLNGVDDAGLDSAQDILIPLKFFPK